MLNLFNGVKKAMENRPAGLYTSPSGDTPETEAKPLSKTLASNTVNKESKPVNFNFAGRMSENRPVSKAEVTHDKPKSKPQEFTHTTQMGATKLPSVVKLAASRSTGVFDANGGEYVNSNDVELLNKLGFILDIDEYSALEKTGEVLDQYSYVEKIAGVPYAVVKAIDKGEAFSGEFLEDMDYDVPKGYEMNGDLCCPMEKESSEKPGLWANIRAKKARGAKPAKPGDEAYPDKEQWDKLSKAGAVAAWQRSEGKNPEGGLNAKGRASYKRETGGTLKAPVTESKPTGERAKRQNSFCSRMCGMKSKNTGSEGQRDPDSRINKSLRKWNCKCGEEHELLIEKVACLIKEAKGRCWEGYKPVKGKKPYSEDSCEPVEAKKKKESELEKESALGAGTNIKLIPRQERISLIRAYRKLLERQDPANKKAIRAIMGANKGESLPKVVSVEGKPSMLHYRAAYNTEALQQPRKERTSFEAHVGPNHGGALSTTVDKKQALRRLDMGRTVGTYSTPLESLATNQKNKDIAAMVNNRWPAEREITQAGGKNLLKAYRYTWRPSLTAPGDWDPVRVNPTTLSKTAGVPEWLRKAILNNDKPTLRSAGQAGAKARATNIAAKKNRAELDRYLNMGAEAAPRVVYPPSAYTVQPTLPGI